MRTNKYQVDFRDFGQLSPIEQDFHLMNHTKVNQHHKEMRNASC
jgi:hypothetical protein